MTGSLIRVSGLAAGYGPGPAIIDGVDMSVAESTLVTVLGPNGGGKTTFFRALLDELPVRSGVVELADRVAYVPQTERTRLDFPVDALAVALMGTYSDAPWYRPVRAELRERAMNALERVGMADRAADNFGQLSGGQRQRVLIARALARDARILLLDEPLAGLDRPSAGQVNEIMGSLRDEGRALLVASHDIQFARDADLVLCLNRKQIAFGPPQQALTDEALRQTYGGELITLPGGDQAVVIQHHHH
jgi:manganese/iron transport system ATP-binding protein/manganese/zinc/iron transport system ATP- binding protein